MTTFQLSDLPLQNLVFELENRKTKGAQEIAAAPLFEQLSLGGPEIIQINKEHVEQDLQNFLEIQAKDFNFYLIHLNVSFNPVEDEPLTEARVWINLKRRDGIKFPEPIALSMQPLVLKAPPITYHRTVKIGVSLEAIGLLTLEIPGLEIEMTETKEEAFLQAFQELTSNPYWQFKSLETNKITGSHRLILIVKIPKGSQIQGKVNIIASVKRKTWGVFSYKAVLEKTPSLSFQLPLFKF